jgi:hypothetical protein
LQGEGQEFESPRLHHARHRAIAVRTSRDHPADTTRRTVGVIPAAIDPLIRVLPPEAIDQRIAGRRVAFGRRARGLASAGPHLNNWICSAERRNLRFRRVSQGNDPDRSHPPTGHLVRGWRGSSYKGHGVDALAPRADEGRGRLRKASGSREQTVIRRCPNGETRLGSCPVTPG